MHRFHEARVVSKFGPLAALILASIASAPALPQAEDGRARKPELAAAQQPVNKTPATVGAAPDALRLSPSARQLAEQLHILDSMEKLKKKEQAYEREKHPRDEIELIRLQQRISMALQHAAFEVEEALAAIDGELALTHMQLAFVSSKRERSLALNNIATFIGSGTFGLLDSSTAIKVGGPAPQILGILGNSIATGMPLANLRRDSYAVPGREEAQANVLAPLFGRPYPEPDYDPIVWSYLNSAAPGSPENLSRLQQLRNNWKTYRRIDAAGGPRTQRYIEKLVGRTQKGEKLTFDILNTRSELLLDIRALVQNMYRDISELNGALLSI